MPGVAVLASVGDFKQSAGGTDGIGVGELERGEAKSEDIGCAEIAYDAPCDHCLDEGVRFGMRKGHLAAPARGLGGSEETPAVAACEMSRTFHEQ